MFWTKAGRVCAWLEGGPGVPILRYNPTSIIDQKHYLYFQKSEAKTKAKNYW